MNKTNSIIFLQVVSVFLSILFISSTATASDWQMFKKDVFNTGVTEDSAPVDMPDSNSWAYVLEDQGMNSLPVIVGNIAYVASSSGVSAIYLNNGTGIWKETCSLGFALSTPAYGDGQVFAAANNKKLYSFDAENGTPAWNIEASSNMLCSPIVYENHRLYFGDTEDYDGNNGTFYCYSDNGSSTPLWSRLATNGRAYYHVSAALIGDYVVYGDNGGNLTSVKKVDGSTVDEINVSETFGKDIGEIWSGVTYDADTQRLYTSTKNASDGGYCLYVGFNPETGIFSGSNAKAISIGYSTSTPSVYGNRVYVGTGEIFSDATQRLLCLNKTTLDYIWEYASEGSIQCAPALSTYYDDGDGEVYIYFTTNSDTGSLYCLKDNATGTLPEKKFVYDGGHPNYSLGGAAVSGGWVLWGNNAGYVMGATTDEALEEAYGSFPAETELLWNGEVTLSSGTFSYVPDANQSANYEWDKLTDLGALAATGLEFETEDLSAGSFWINGIAGIDNEPWGTGAMSWSIFINGEEAASGLGGNSLKEGDIVSFYYLPWDTVTYEPLVEEAAYVINVSIKESDDNWNQFHKDAAHTGFSSSNAPDTNNLLWVSDSIWATPSSSPVIADGKVFVKCGADSFLGLMPSLVEENMIVALDMLTGNYLFDSSAGEIEGSWSSPCYYDGKVRCGRPTEGVGGSTVADGKIFDSNNSEHLYYCTDEETGENLWSFKVTGDARGTPAYYEDKVYLTSGPVFSSPGYIYCVDSESGKEIWNQTISSQAAGSAAVSDGVVYVTAYSGGLYAIDAKDGSVLWNTTVPSTDISSTPAIAYGNVYISGGCPGYSSIRTYCYNTTTHEMVWSTAEEDEIGGWTISVAVADGMVFVGKHSEGDFFGHSGTYALDAFTGDVVWSSSYGGASPAVSDGIVFTIGADGRVYAFADPAEVLPSVSNMSDSSSGESSGDSSGGSSGSSSGGSSGGGGGSPEPASNVQVKEISQQFVTNGNHINFEFPQEATSVAHIRFDSKKSAGKITTIVEELKEKSVLTPTEPEGQIYRHLNIWVGNEGFATQENIENSSIWFRVSKAWITENDIDVNSITLQRFADDTWNSLPTTKLDEQEEYFVFEAKTPGFSPFAITGQKNGYSTELKTDEAGPNIQDMQTRTSAENGNEDEKDLKASPGFCSVLAAVGILVSAVMVKRK